MAALVATATFTAGIGAPAFAGSERSTKRDHNERDRSERDERDERDDDRHESRSVRLEGSCRTTFVFTGPLSLHIEGRCLFKRFGPMTLTAEQQIIPNPDGTTRLVNNTVYTAPNGDTLLGSFDGPSFPISEIQLGFTGTETFTGGTGRFSGATGSATDQGSAWVGGPLAGTGSFTTVGTLELDSPHHR